MATRKPASLRTARASKKAGAPLDSVHQAHGALNPSTVNMDEIFGIKSVYTARSIDQYREQLDQYTITDLHSHAHQVGVIPLDPREKLVTALERKFWEVQSKSRPTNAIPLKVAPGGEDFIKKFMSGNV